GQGRGRRRRTWGGQRARHAPRTNATRSAGGRGESPPGARPGGACHSAGRKRNRHDCRQSSGPGTASLPRRQRSIPVYSVSSYYLSFEDLIDNSGTDPANTTAYLKYFIAVGPY